MERTEVSFDIETIPLSIRQYIKGATIYDSSCSENAKTLFVSGEERAFLKISKRGSLEREYKMTNFLHKHNVAPNAIAYESELDYDYLFTEAVSGEDGTAVPHIENPSKLACVFGEYLKMLHSLPTEGCPYGNRTNELLSEAHIKGIDLSIMNDYNYSATDNVIIHGDYCLPNIIMDNFSFKGFIDLGYGGVGDRHYDIYWGIWTLNYNLRTNKYRDLFLDAYGRTGADRTIFAARPPECRWRRKNDRRYTRPWRHFRIPDAVSSRPAYAVLLWPASSRRRRERHVRAHRSGAKR